MPWDQPGSAWQGTIETDTSFTTEDSNGKTVVSHQASYSEISPLQDTADGDYDAEVVAGGSEDIWGACYGKEGVDNHLWNYRWQLDTRVEDPLTTTGKFGLTTTDEGQTFFALWYQGLIPFDWTAYCTGDGVPAEGSNPKENGFTKLGFLDGSTHGYSSQPLPDSDPDPLHLVGSKTWTLGDPPVVGMMPENMTQYTLTMTYDLELVVLPPECDTFKSKTRKWSAKTPIRLLPDRHWGDFKAVVDWCYDSSDPTFGKITAIRSRGTVDDGPLGAFSRAAGFFGFTTEWENQECDPVQDPQCGDISEHEVTYASVTRKMAFCFNFAKLLDKLGVKGWLEERVKRRLRSKLTAIIEENGDLYGGNIEVSDELVKWIDDFIGRAAGRIDGIDELLRDKHVPGFLAEWIEDQVEDPFADLTENWKQDLVDALESGAFERMAADQATDAMLDPLIDRIFNILRVCDSGAFALGKDYPGFLVLWQPLVTAMLLDDGKLDIERVDLYKHPALKIERID